MKKGLLLFLGVVLLASTLWFSTGTVSAASSKVVLFIEGVTEADVRGARMSVGSNTYDVYCVLSDAASGKVICHVPGRFAGQNVRIFIGGKYQDVSVPKLQPVVEKTDTPVDCEATPDHVDCELPVDCETDPKHVDCEPTFDCVNYYSVFVYDHKDELVDGAIYIPEWELDWFVSHFNERYPSLGYSVETVGPYEICEFWH